MLYNVVPSAKEEAVPNGVFHRRNRVTLAQEDPETPPGEEGAKPEAGHRWVRSFHDYAGESRELLGGKGYGLAEMTSLGLPIPEGFTITTEACLAYFRDGNMAPEALWKEVGLSVRALEARRGQRLGDPDSPLLVSVRSGAAVSMPGMMDTVLNLGINRGVAEGIARRSGNPAFAYDLYLRFIQMYGEVVMGVDSSHFSGVRDEWLAHAGAASTSHLDFESLEAIISEYHGIVFDATGREVPEDPEVQLRSAVLSVFDSWNSARAIDYRNHYGISHDMGTAVSVVAMVYGNMDERSGTGVCFTRNPATGERTLFGEYLANAQGEELVSGASTPSDISGLSDSMPEVYSQIVDCAQLLEKRFGDAQDIEFTVESGKLYLLQTRAAQRSPRAAVRMAVEMSGEGLISREEALKRVNPDQVYNLLVPRLDESAAEEAREDGRLVAVGLGASPGGATGRLTFSADEAQRLANEGVRVVLARPETSPEDVHGMLAAAGIVTSRGGTTSHAAVVARGLGKPCVTGAESLTVNPEDGYIESGDVVVREGEDISIDGATGEIFMGEITTLQPSISGEQHMVELLSWADDAKRLGVWANADYPRDVRTALEFGAEGIGLCRTEHMFFEPERLDMVRSMILAAHDCADSPEGECDTEFHASLAVLEGYQTEDFEAIFRALEGRPAVIRLLDPPLHEFLPSFAEILEDVVELKAAGGPVETLAAKTALLTHLEDMREVNPMLGLRGCRLGLKFPAIYEMQTRAIIAAACNVSAEGMAVHPEIMVPLVSHGNEMRMLRQNLEATINAYFEDTGRSVNYKIGTMIELPRAALTADEIAETAQFFSFGTNDLTQTTYGYSRDDAEGKFLMKYLERGILPEDPFQALDRSGVGRLIEMATRLGRNAHSDIILGICGEHGGDPSSIEFCHNTGLDYVSCSPYRVPVARLAAAQAALNHTPA